MGAPFDYENPLLGQYRENWQASIHHDGFGRARYLHVTARVLNHEGSGLVRQYAAVAPPTLVLVKRHAPQPPMLMETWESRQDGVGDVTGFVQAVMDAAWEAGLRPSQYRDAIQELGAVRYHLEDMRSLALGSKFKPPK